VHPDYVHQLNEAPVSTASKSGFDSLPCVLIHKTATYLGHRELSALAMCNKRCRFCCSDDRLWRKLVLERFGWEPAHDPAATGCSWRAFYRFQQEFFQEVILRRATDTLMHMRMGNLNMPSAGGFMPVMV